jgi:predicted permease
MLRPLVSLQIGFSLAILFVAGLLLQSFDRLTRVDLGFSPDHVVLATIEARERLTDAASLAAGRQLLDAVRAIPGVESASLSDWALFAGWSSGGHLEIPGRRTVQTRTLGVSPDFCRTMDIRLLDGREFEPRDSTPDGPTAVIVNDAFVQKYLAGERATGRRVERKLRTWTDRLEVVGVVADVKNNTVRGTSAVPFVFLPASGPEGTLQVRTRMDPGVVAARLRDRLPRVHPSLRLTDVTLQTSLVGNAMLRERLLAVLSGFFAAVGLLLAAIGLYGVTSFAVVRRTREIGVRLALGARPSAVVRSVLGGVAIAATIGTIGGLAGGLYFARFVRALLYDTEPLDAWSLLAPIGGLLLVVLVAAWHPARRAARVDPVAALRVE